MPLYILKIQQEDRCDWDEDEVLIVKANNQQLVKNWCMLEKDTDLIEIEECKIIEINEKMYIDLKNKRKNVYRS